MLAQVKEACQLASQCGTSGPYLHQLFNLAVAAAKQVQTEMALGQHHLSMGSLTVQMIRKVFEHLGQLQVLVLGTGKMALLALKHLCEAGAGGITVCSRSPARAREAAATCEA